MASTMTGVVFDIRELTVHDGPGLRTTVFLKGCPLRCAWCHNPEGLSPAPQPMHSAHGRRVAGRSYTSAGLAEILNRQAPLLAGAGGVTFSGGEPLMQADFLSETVDRLENLHVTLDTSGCAPPRDFQRVAQKCDLILFDIKLVDAEEHKQWTGVGNQIILENLKLLDEMGKPFIIRVPLVPGVTDTKKNLCAIAQCVSKLSSRPRVELLPYNKVAGGKYAACGMEWKPAYDENSAVSPDLTPFKEQNLDAVIV